MLRIKIVHLKQIDKFYFDHFLEKRTVFILIKKTLLKIKSCGFRTNSATYETNVKKQNCSFQKDLQILFLPFFDRNNSFSYKHQKCY